MRHTLLLLAGLTAAGPGPGPKVASPCRLMVLTVGVNDYSGYTDLRVQYAGHAQSGHLMSLGSAEKDAQRFARHLASTWKCQEEPHVEILTGAEATGTKVIRRLQDMQRVAADYVVLYFASHGGPFNVVPGQPVQDFALPLSPSPNCVHARSLTELVSLSCALTGRRIKSLLDQLQARRQLLVRDAGIGGLGSIFLAGLAERNPLGADLAGQSRAIISTRGPAPENEDGGLLTSALLDSALAGAIRDDLQDEPKGALTQLLNARVAQLDPAGAGFGPTVFYERDLLPLLSTMQTTAESLPSRETGAAGPGPARPAVRPLGVGNYALIVGTGEYEATNQWRRLANPVADAAALDSILRTRYGFNTILLTNTPPSTSSSWASRRSGSDSQSQVLVFVAGHGLYDEKSGSGALVHRDSKSTAEDEFLDSYTTFPFFASMTNALAARHVLVVLDVCFGGLFSGQLRDQGTAGTSRPTRDSRRRSMRDARWPIAPVST